MSDEPDFGQIKKPLKISGFIIVGSNSLQLIAIYHLPMHQVYIIEDQQLFILKGTSCILTIERSRKESVRCLHSMAFAHGLVPPFPVFL